MNRAWRRTSSILALTIAGFATQARAQSEAQAVGETQQQAGSAADQQGLQEIIVTAQRKAENLQRAGIPVAVVTGDQLVSRGLTSSNELGTSVPSLSPQPQGGANTTFFLRGVGNFTVNGYSDPAVAFNYDGVYLGRATSTSGIFYDLERVEVLKGPQGTLYGRNATAGAINVLPTRPRIGENSGFVTASYGNYDAVNVQGAVNVAMGEHGALRIAGNVVRRDGYQDDGTSDEKTQALRVQLLSELTPNLTVRVGGDFSHSGGKGPGSTYSGRIVFNGTTNLFVPSGFRPDSGLFSADAQAYRQTLFSGLVGRTLAPLDVQPYLDNNYYGANAEISLRTGAGTLTVIPSWRYSKLDNRFAVPAFYGDVAETDEQKSLEVRFAGNRIGIFDYMLGAYYFDESVAATYLYAQQALNAYQQFTSGTKSYAGFGRLTANLSDRLRLIGGLRYTKDDKDFNGRADVFLVRCTVVVQGRPSCPGAPLLPSAGRYQDLPTSIYPSVPDNQARPIGATGALLIHAVTPVNTTLSNDRLTYHLGAEFDLGPHSLLYASYETGYRSGGFALSAGYETFQPEYIDAYTVGMKNRFFDNRLQLNVEAFLWKYRNQQVNHTGIDKNGNQGQFTENVGKSTNKGVEVEAQLLATRTTLLSANVQYLDAKYDSFVYREPIGATPPVTGCPYRPSATPGTYDINCSGRAAYLSPKWTMNLGAQQTVPLGDYKAVLSADTQYRSSRVVGFEYMPNQLVGATWVSNAQIAFGSADDRWSIAAFVRNIEDERYQASAQIYSVGSAALAVYSPPRTYGVRVTSKF
ncbi:TonB-dependent receptor [Sphingomonas sp. TDK1]|uniref:TonB-dependent receptor n=1 Tax=Sphingomonas sp. TDK1 TaxID=453247 RepID=UPI0007D95075|nr:TonB-dependent receptor [Sphingomonas sp. TDK1]OAN62365.1 TonB-dependent receptor [Sphingomonas sp. TDK1]